MSEIDDPWIQVGKRIDAWRVVPRLIIAAYFAFFIKAWLLVFNWFKDYDWHGLPADPVIGAAAVVAVAGFPALMLGQLTNVLFKLITGKWGGEPQ